MENQNSVVLYGSFGSPYCIRVELALKLKGIPYKYIEEDLTNKSDSLLRYNPVRKKVPTLVHNGKAISESLVILEYIDECWTNAPKLLPEDPYQKAKFRFWANFYDQKLLGEIVYAIMQTKGDEQGKAIEQYLEALSVFEEGIEEFSTKSPFINGDTLGFLDIIVGANSCSYKAFHEAFAVVLDPKKHPSFFAWVTAMKEFPVMKETLPPHDKLVALVRNKFSMSPEA